jgi:hypothetical protein
MTIIAFAWNTADHFEEEENVANGHGGKRASAGRKRNGDTAAPRRIMRGAIDEQQWKRIVENIARIAEGGDGKDAVMAFSALAPHAFGEGRKEWVIIFSGALHLLLTRGTITISCVL